MIYIKLVKLAFSAIFDFGNKIEKGHVSQGTRETETIN